MTEKLTLLQRIERKLRSFHPSPYQVAYRVAAFEQENKLGIAQTHPVPQFTDQGRCKVDVSHVA
jgi:hypothetical protein